MKKGQKLTKNGYQLIGFPMEYMNITQGNNGQFSHQGVNALDLAGKDTGIDETIAPADMHYVWNDSSANGNAIFFQSDNKVLWADGTIDYFTLVCVHDNDISDILARARAGLTWKQGETFGDEGTAGYATGNHCHFEIAKGKFVKPYQQNSQGVYSLYKSVSADLACVTDGTVLINKGQTSGSGNKMYWKTSSQIGTSSNSVTLDVLKWENMEEETYAVKFNVDGVRIRLNSSDGTVVAFVDNGEIIKYTRKGLCNGYRYIGWDDPTYGKVMAAWNTEDRQNPWGELVDPDEVETTTETKKEEVVQSYEDTLDEAEDLDVTPEVLESQHGLEVTVSLVDRNHWKARCPYLMKPEYVVIHNAETKNGTAKSLCTVQNKTVETEDKLKSWHFSVDEKGAWESLPLNRNGFHASDGGDGDGNRKGIAIEIARDLAGEEEYYEASENNGALLAAILLNKYGLDTSHLKTHHDFARNKKWCPHKILDNGWDKFVAKVQAYLDEIQKDEQPKEDVPVETPVEIPTEAVKPAESNEETSGLINTLLKALIELVNNILSSFKK